MWFKGTIRLCDANRWLRWGATLTPGYLPQWGKLELAENRAVPGESHMLNPPSPSPHLKLPFTDNQLRLLLTFHAHQSFLNPSFTVGSPGAIFKTSALVPTPHSLLIGLRVGLWESRNFIGGFHVQSGLRTLDTKCLSPLLPPIFPGRYSYPLPGRVGGPESLGALKTHRQLALEESQVQLSLTLKCQAPTENTCQISL